MHVVKEWTVNEIAPDPANRLSAPDVAMVLRTGEKESEQVFSFRVPAHLWERFRKLVGVPA